MTTCRGLASNGQIWVAVGVNSNVSPNGSIITSRDGINWSSATITGTNLVIYYAIAWNGTRWVAGGGDQVGNTLAWSDNGTNWTIIVNSYFYSCRAITWNGLIWIACSNFLLNTPNTLAYSYDGKGWMPVPNSKTTIIACRGIASRRILPNVGINNNNNSQQNNSNIQIGYQSGFSSQGAYSIAIGNKAGTANQFSNSIIVNASSNALENTTLSGLFIQPIRLDTATTVNSLFYNTTTKEIVYNNTTGVSDVRLKTNIVEADQNMCYETIESLKLKYFEWDDSFYNHTGMNDKHALGFIAQEVKSYFPKSVQITSNQFYPDFHSLNPDQIYKANVGATQQLMAIVKAQQSTIDNLSESMRMLLNSRTT